LASDKGEEEKIRKEPKSLEEFRPKRMQKDYENLEKLIMQGAENDDEEEEGE